MNKPRAHFQDFARASTAKVTTAGLNACVDLLNAIAAIQKDHVDGRAHTDRVNGAALFEEQTLPHAYGGAR
jgi:hypothetical protein